VATPDRGTGDKNSGGTYRASDRAQELRFKEWAYCIDALAFPPPLASDASIRIYSYMTKI